MEKAVYTQHDYLAENNILNDNQFGFRQKTTTALLSLLMRFFDFQYGKGRSVCCCVLGPVQGFDTVDLAIMVKKLSAIGVSTDDLAWFASYLNFRSLRTNCAPGLPEPLLCNFGVPQGSILGPF